MSFIKRRLAFVFVRLENIQWQQIRWGSMYIKCVILQLLYLECLPELVEQSSLCRFLVISRCYNYGTRFLSTSSYDFGKWNPLGALGAALFFGFAQSLGITGGTIPVLKRNSKCILNNITICIHNISTCWFCRSF